MSAAAPIDAATDAQYRRLRIQVFAGIFIGYAAFYLVRKNLSLAIPDILKTHPEYNKAMLGTAMTGLSISYGASKFLMGSVSDRSNPRWFMMIGLALSCLIMAMSGLYKALFSSIGLIVTLQILNGWFQGMGWPPCGKTMVHWFSIKERGLVVSSWNIAHNVGGAMVAHLALAGVFLFGDWGAKFYFNAIVAACLGLIAFILMRDTPQSCGLPPVEVYRNDYSNDYSEEKEQALPYRDIFFKYVLNNRQLWFLALANAFVYFVRYGVEDWIPTYLQTAKGYSFKESSIAWSLYEWAAIPGTILCGWVSDRKFQSKRAPTCILFMSLTLGAVIVYGLNRHGPLWIDYAALLTMGFLIYGPIMIIGLHALDLAPKKAAGTAAGFTGFFGYAFGSALAGAGVGWLSEHLGWNAVFFSLIACCTLSIFFTALTLEKQTPNRSSVR